MKKENLSVDISTKEAGADVVSNGMTPVNEANVTESPIQSPYLKEIILPNGKNAGLLSFKGKQYREAQRWAKGDDTLLEFALIAGCVEIDGKKISPYDLDEMDIKDVIALKQFADVNFTSAPSN